MNFSYSIKLSQTEQQPVHLSLNYESFNNARVFRTLRIILLYMYRIRIRTYNELCPHLAVHVQLYTIGGNFDAFVNDYYK